MKVTPIATFEFVPKIPESLSELQTLAYNFFWTWTPTIRHLLRDIDPDLWVHTRRNPARLLKEVSQKRIDALANDSEFSKRYHQCVEEYRRYMSAPTWFGKVSGDVSARELVYFSMEYGISECLPVYSGGLGVLSGDHLKTASDLGLPLVGIGLAYRQGYFQQQLTRDGYQTELYPENDFHRIPVHPVLDETGNRVLVSLQFPGRRIHVAAWKAQVGRVPLYLLDTDVPENDPLDRRITHTLYGGDKETRVQQELILGFGGIAMAGALGTQTHVCHMNEGHSAFIQFARLIKAREQGMSTDEALQLIESGSVFTTHTPVPAGIDQFARDLMSKYFSAHLDQIGVSFDDLMAWGSKERGDTAQQFNMAIFALRTSEHTNAVSRLHAGVSRNLWATSWPNLPLDEIPIDYVTNGIHMNTWISDEMIRVFDSHLDPAWKADPDHKHLWHKVREIPDEVIWSARVEQRARLVQFCRARIRNYQLRTSVAGSEDFDTSKLLNPHALTIGFARRFATYKRATLILRYPERLLALLRNHERPVQIIFAGKAHPQDEAGKAFIHDLIYFARSESVQHCLVFLENYDMHVAQHLVQGVDMWMNNPRRPLEASGTSGMKVLANGGLNFSVLDGWWDEAYSPRVGWAIGRDKTLSDEKAQDDRDAQSLFDTLEHHIVPLFYDRQKQGVPHGWIEKVRESIIELVPRFNTGRMVKEYCEDYYIPALKRAHEFASNGRVNARLLAQWRRKVEENWDKVRVNRVAFQTAQSNSGMIRIDAEIELGFLAPEDVEVQVYYGRLNGDGGLVDAESAALKPASAGGKFTGEIRMSESGSFGYTVRVVPSHDLISNPLRLGLVTWAEGSTAH